MVVSEVVSLADVSDDVWAPPDVVTVVCAAVCDPTGASGVLA